MTSPILGNLELSGTASWTLGAALGVNGNVTIGTGTTLNVGASSFALEVKGDFANSGTFTAQSGTVTLSGTTKQTLSGSMINGNSFYNLTITNSSGTSASDNERTDFVPSIDFDAAATVTNNYVITTANVRVEYNSGSTYTIANINWNGQAVGTRIYFRNSAITGTWSLNVSGTQTAVFYVNVSRSNASGGSAIVASDGTNFDAGSNTNWNFGASQNPSISSAANQRFAIGQTSTLASTITLSDGTTPEITTANDIRVAIATTTGFGMEFDQTITTPTFGGSASSKVSATVSYLSPSELFITVSSGFAASDTLTISGLKFTNFTAPAKSGTEAILLYTSGSTAGAAAASTTQIVTIGLGKIARINKPPNYLSTGNGLVAYYTFDGKDMYQNVADSSGQGNTGYLIVGAGGANTSTTTAPGRIGQALNFDGTDDYVLINDHTSLRMTTSLTVSTWVKLSGTQSSKYILTKRDGLGGTDEYALIYGFTANKYEFYAEGYAGEDPRTALNTSVSDTGWHQIVWTYNGTTIKGYLDGVIDISTDKSFTLNSNSAPVMLGTEGGNYLSGLEDEVRIYNRALSAEEIGFLYRAGSARVNKTPVGPPNLSSGLVGHWTFDGKNMYQNVADSSGQGNNLYIFGQTSTTTGPGRMGQAMSLDGVNDFIAVSSTGSASAALSFGGADRLRWTSLASALANVPGGAWTVAVLARRGATGSTHAMTYLLSSGNASLVGMSFGGANDLFVDAGALPKTTTTFLDTTDPYLLVISKAAGSATPRAGFKLASGGSWTHENLDAALGDQTTAVDLEIGAWQNTSDFFVGHIGVVGFWSGAMSDANKETLDDNWATSDWYNSAHGTPLALFELNVAAGSVVDLVGNATSLAAEAGGDYPTLDTGQTLNGWNFDGAITGGASGITGIKTISFWAKPDSVTQDIMDLDGTQTIDISAGTVQANNFNTPTIYVDGVVTSTFPSAEWHFVTVTTDTGIDATEFSIGKVSDYYSGKIDDIRLYNRQLTAGEIAQLYTLGKVNVRP